MATVNTSRKWQAVNDGLDFMLKHFEGAQDLWPRKVQTIERNGRQATAYSKEHAMSIFEQADWIDVRINAYPVYREGALYTPNHLLFDIDRKHFSTEQEFLQAVNATIDNIKLEFGGDSYPSIIDSGNGYHLHLPMDMPKPLEEIPEFANFFDPSQNFLRYAEVTLSNRQADPDHTLSFRSSLFRVPGTYNLKCIKSGKDAQVKIVQRWNGIRVRPCREFMLNFHSHMVQQSIDRKVEIIKWQNNKRPRLSAAGSFKSSISYIKWIETLFRTPINDHRKRARDLILIPYLVVRRGLSDPDRIHDIVMQWADKCDILKPLDPSWSEFEERVRSRIDQVLQNRISQMKWSTLQEENPDLCKLLTRRQQGKPA